MSLLNKRILITAGPTWVPIDAVRVISNTATGQTGILLAQGLIARGARVMLLLGPTQYAGAGFKPAPETGICNVGTAQCAVPTDTRNLKIVRFHFFDELKKLVSTQLRRAKFDAVIHSAAVSDYRPKRRVGKKIASGISNLRLNLRPTEKLIDRIKKYDPSVYLVGFKFHPGASTRVLIREAAALAKRSKADIVAANTILAGKYRAYIVKEGICTVPLSGKAALARRICDILGVEL